jgi:hydroxypyruvate isomerase
MPSFAANLTMLYTELDFLDRFAAARADGFEGVEYLFPYAYPAERLADVLHEHGLTQVLHNLPAGDWAAGERGIAVRPDRVDEFRRGVGEAVRYATALGCTRVNCLAGIAPPGADPATLRRTFVDNLRWAAPRLRDAGIRLLIEPINTFDIPGFWLSGTRQALELIDEVGSDNLYLQYDLYHAQRMEGELARTLQAHLPRIAHVHVADNPGRHEPGSGEIHYPFLFEWIDGLGYDGWIGCEYKPRADTRTGLGWIQQFRRKKS